jgi:hypothetical protein
MLAKNEFIYNNAVIEVTSGVPQGSKTGPIFFDYYLANAIEEVKDQLPVELKESFSLYADDIALTTDT